ncbi:carbon-nitrogen hydrolase family protein [Terrarubrum flagellatum]|uniref:carbon-nitrogen hydrolase family protein n=1 Tax=Terrirubrum flagellatum TaxID=2895980 RepID=UPI00314500B5
MKVALIQMNSDTDKQANLAQARELMEQAIREDQPDWIMLPEVWDYLGGRKPDQQAAAEELPGGPAWTLCRDIAREHKVFVHAGSILEKVPGEDRLHNTTVVFNRKGEEVARYRKIHLFDITTPDGSEYKESASFAPGDAVVTYDCEGVTIGCSICYDLRFPELFQALARKGAQMIALPAAFTLATGKDHWEVLLRARAIENETYVAAAAQTGLHNEGNERRACYGHSLVIDPWGHVIAKASDGVGTAATRIDMKRVDKARAQIPVAQHKRPELFA